MKSNKTHARKSYHGSNHILEIEEEYSNVNDLEMESTLDVKEASRIFPFTFINYLAEELDTFILFSPEVVSFTVCFFGCVLASLVISLQAKNLFAEGSKFFEKFASCSNM